MERSSGTVFSSLIASLASFAAFLAVASAAYADGTVSSTLPSGGTDVHCRCRCISGDGKGSVRQSTHVVHTREDIWCDPYYLQLPFSTPLVPYLRGLHKCWSVSLHEWALEAAVLVWVASRSSTEQTQRQTHPLPSALHRGCTTDCLLASACCCPQVV
jgi:hypothetical protein